MIIDADAHLIEGAPFVQRALERWPERVSLHEDLTFGIDGLRYPKRDGTGVGVPPQHSLCETGVDDAPYTVAGMVGAADREGIDVMVLYPSLGLAAHSIRDARFGCEFAGALNEYMAEWTAASGGRLRGVATVPLRHPEAAIKVLARAKSLGLCAATIPPALDEQNLDHPGLDRFYAAAADMEMPLAVHGAPGLHMPPIGVDRFANYIQVHCVSFPFDQMVAMTAMVTGGVLERHPELRVAFVEAGATWLPYFLDRLHEHYEKRASWIERGWGRDPREYLARGQIFVTCEADETLLGATVDALGEDCIMYASDYPHWDSEYPRSSRGLRERDDISEAARAKILGGTARRFYGL
jgi:predicted TIM-barrel fold metal-dependent hydrolase